jgi:hypothetical protein
MSYSLGDLFDSPVGVFGFSLIVQWLAAYFGEFLHRRVRPISKDEREDLDTVQAAILTLLALIIGFSFSMAVTRYDQRKTYEEAEANAIGTEYLRIDLLPADDAANVRALMRKYLDLRIAFYETTDRGELARISADTTKLQAELWSAAAAAANAQPTAVKALAVAGMNDMLNAQGYTQAAWWNRIPVAAWALMGLIAIACNLVLGYGEHSKRMVLLLVIPVVVSISFLLIADIDSPRGGVIRVMPVNLIAVAQSLKGS